MADAVSDALGLWGLSGKVTEHLSGGAPEKSFLGGSQERLDQQRGALWGAGQQGTGRGARFTGQGVNMLGQAAGQAQDDRSYGYGLAGQGRAMLGGSLANARGLAGRPTDSLAQAQLQQGLAQQQQQMLGQAAQARGGSQAAALRNAQMLGSQAGLQTNQAAAMMRAQEQQAQLARQLGVEQMAQQAGAQQLGLGLGAAQQGTQNLGAFGGQVGQLGLGQQNVGLGAYGLLNDANRAQLEADRANASAAAVARSPAATFGSILGGVTQLWGGGGGR